MKRKSISTSYLFTALKVCGISCFLASCEKEIVNGGTAPFLNLSVSEIPFGSDTTLTRSGEGHQVLETVEIVLSNGWIATVDLEKEAAAPTRAGNYNTIVEDAKFRLVVYDGSDTYVGNSEYQYQAGQLKKIGGDILLSTTPGTAYTFVLYSYNRPGVSLPYTAAGVAVTSYLNGTDNYDLLWGKQTATIDASGLCPAITVSLAHKFSRVKVRVTCVDDVTLSEVKITSNYPGTLALSAGTLTPGASTTTAQPLTGGTITTKGTSATSDYNLVYTGTHTPEVSIKGTVGAVDTPFDNVKASFVNTLNAGDSYILQVNLKNPPVKWAGSNIYWNGSALTFEPYGPPSAKNNYQGVFFIFGSLVGISPSNPDNQTLFSGGTINNPATGNPIYVHNGSQWIQTNVATASNVPYDGFTPGASNGEDAATSFHRIPYYNTADYAELVTLGFSNNRGDICRFIDSGYRMPTAGEVSSANFILNGTWSGINYNNLLANGQYSIAHGISSYGIKFPASGWHSGILSDVGVYTGYWTGNSTIDHSVLKAYMLACGTYNYYITCAVYFREYAFPIRCVMN
ncbi:MAG: fimbrillin family protein [Dysgonamonadaceae bacterium]|jgi:hypothetical protein|nr:fimbrillin family protein [Dysgonamonadaceae bacterium]